MHRKLLSFVPVLLIVAFSGCASKKPPVVAAERPVVRRIAVVPATEPTSLSFENRSSVLFLSPIVGMGVALDSKDKSRRFNQDPRTRHFDLASRFTAPVVNALREAGYEVAVLDGIARPADDLDDVDLDKVAPDADAVLQLRVRAAGLYAGLLSNDYLPRVNVDGHLQVRASEDDFYDEHLYYGVEPRPSAKVDIPPDPRHAYPTFDAVMARMDEVGTALQTGADALGRLMAKQLLQALATKTRRVP